MSVASTTMTISSAIARFLDQISLARSENTARTYANALQSFAALLKNKKIDADKTSLDQLNEDAVGWFATYLKEYAPATEQLYLTALAGFFEYLAAERLAEPNLPRMRLLIRQRSRKPGQRLPQFPRDYIEQIVEYAIKIALLATETENERLINLRDRAFLLTLADTGLRVHEACNLRRGDLDQHESRALIIGKGDRQAVVRFSQRSLTAVKDYLHARSELDGATGRPLSTLPLFARHDRGAGKKVKPITTTTGRKIVHQRAREAVSEPEGSYEITPHSFRHYFVTAVLRGSGGNLKLAQELARHKNIAVTQRYAHLSDVELDKGYEEIFD